MNRILLAEDDPDLRKIISSCLTGAGYSVVACRDGEEALSAFYENSFSLVISDIMMPRLDGIQTMAKLREFSNVPVLLLTAKSEDADIILGLNVGADDYITKPFIPLELVARVKAQLRRFKRYSTGAKPEDDIIIHGGLMLNAKTHECTLNEKPLALTPTEFSILKILCQNRGNVVSSEEMFRTIWNEEYYSKNNNTITVHIRHLREKMGDSFESPKYIKTVWGVGYKIEG